MKLFCISAVCAFLMALGIVSISMPVDAGDPVGFQCGCPAAPFGYIIGDITCAEEKLDSGSVMTKCVGECEYILTMKSSPISELTSDTPFLKKRDCINNG